MKCWFALSLSLFLAFPSAAKESSSSTGAKSTPADKTTPKVKTPAKPAEEAEGEAEEHEKTLNDFPGETYTGTPRLIRQDAMTEVFFRDLNNSYVIHDDSRHNRFYKMFDEGIRANKSVTFRADPYSRRITAVDGVDGVKAPPPPAPTNPATGAH